MSRFKVSANIGSLGKASFEPYEAQDVYNYYKGQWYAGGLGAIMSTLGNANLQWEKTKTHRCQLRNRFPERFDYGERQLLSQADQRFSEQHYLTAFLRVSKLSG